MIRLLALPRSEHGVVGGRDARRQQAEAHDERGDGEMRENEDCGGDGQHGVDSAALYAALCAALYAALCAALYAALYAASYSGESHPE